MNTRQFLNLQEAYMDVYNELDEGVADDIAARARKLARRHPKGSDERNTYLGLASKAQARADVHNPIRASIGLSRFERSQEEGPVITPDSSERSRESSAYSYSLFGGKRGEHTYGAGSLPRRRRRLYKQVASGVRSPKGIDPLELLMSAGGMKLKTQRESYDLYDIILSHLLDEGYANTLEAAEAIMENMSEEWIQSIID